MKSKSGKFLLARLAIALLVGIMASCNTPDPKFQQYLVEGEQLYLVHCSNCHQKDGRGLRRVYPPLAPSDYMDQNFEKVICGMKYGLQGEISVNGNSYVQAMPGVPSLTELELAEIATYIYNSWGHQRGLIESKSMAALLDSCARPRYRR